MLKKYDYRPEIHKLFAKAQEKTLKWNISKIALYIIEIQTRYKHYSPKYVDYLFEFCETFIKCYYSEDDANKLIDELKRHIFNDKSRFNSKLTNYIVQLPELRWLYGIHGGTGNISKEWFTRWHGILA